MDGHIFVIYSLLRKPHNVKNEIPVLFCCVIGHYQLWQLNCMLSKNHHGAIKKILPRYLQLPVLGQAEAMICELPLGLL